MRKLGCLILTALTLTACSKSDGARETGLHSYETPAPRLEPRDTTDADSIVQAPPMTSLGVGPVRLGMEVSAMPRVLPGVYDSIEVSLDVIAYDEDATAVRFLRKGAVVMTGEAVESEDRKTRVVMLSVVGRGPGVNIGESRVVVGTRGAALRRLRGVRELSADSASTYYDWRGVTISVTADTVDALFIE